METNITVVFPSGSRHHVSIKVRGMHMFQCDEFREKSRLVVDLRAELHVRAAKFLDERLTTALVWNTKCGSLAHGAIHPG